MSTNGIRNQNFFIGVIYNSLFWAGIGFISYTTILPSFLGIFTQSPVLIGIISSVAGGLWLLPQSVVSKYVKNLRFKKPAYFLVCLVRNQLWLIFALIVYIFLKDRIVLLLFFIILALFYGMGSIESLLWNSLVQKLIPITRRGSFAAFGNIFGGIGAVGIGFMIKYFIDNYSFPFNYGILFLLCGVVLNLALFAFNRIEEKFPSSLSLDDSNYSAQANANNSFVSHFKESFSMVRENTNYKNYFFSRILIEMRYLSFPFYAFYIVKVLGIEKSSIGLFFSIQMIGTFLAALVIGCIGDKKGYTRLIPIVVLLSALTPLPIIAGQYFPNQAIFFFSLTFFLVGISLAGSYIGYTNYLFEITTNYQFPIFRGLVSSFVGLMIIILPILGGFILRISHNNYNLLFLITFISMIMPFMKSFGLIEPRALNK